MPDQKTAADARPTPFERAQGKLGLGCMRLPLLKDGTVDLEVFDRMVDTYLAAGLNYFDTARPYLKGESERALRASLTSRHPRESYVIADKLSGSTFQTADDIPCVIEGQLQTLGVDAIDLYLLHGQGQANYQKFQDCRAYEQALGFRDQGLVRHVGLSFHDSATFLEKILDENPGMEFVQLQINYLDWESAAVQSRECYEVCRRRNLPVIVMEPVKGGRLVDLPEAATAELAAVGGAPAASYALRFAAGLPGVEMVLSGMGSVGMVEENVKSFSPLEPLSEAELMAVERVRDILLGQDRIACTACRYCVDGCPAGIKIPEVIACLNARKAGLEDDGSGYYSICTGGDAGKASDCVGCGRCEAVCPQHLPIREVLTEAAAALE